MKTMNTATVIADAERYLRERGDTASEISPAEMEALQRELAESQAERDAIFKEEGGIDLMAVEYGLV